MVNLSLWCHTTHVKLQSNSSKTLYNISQSRVDKTAAMFSFISSRFRGKCGKNTVSVTYGHQKTSHGVISGNMSVQFILSNSVLCVARLRDIYET
jgi:hypothetical protein